jgi:hypothetical protein
MIKNKFSRKSSFPQQKNLRWRKLFKRGIERKPSGRHILLLSEVERTSNGIFKLGHKT